MQLGCMGRFDFALMESQLLGVSLRARRDTTEVYSLYLCDGFSHFRTMELLRFTIFT